MTGNTQRDRGLDVARGLIMVLMAIDHVRVYAGVPAGGPTPALFFTRWVTHFCAPGFVFFSGTSAYLRGTRSSHRELSRFLLQRGLMLVLIDLTIMRFFWTFNFDVIDYNLAGVLWMIGWSMVAMAALLWLPLSAIAAVGMVIVLAHNIVDPYVRDLVRALSAHQGWSLWQFLYFGGSLRLGEHGPRISILYVLIPWIGVMALGYAFGRVLALPIERRRRICLAIGIGAIAAFVALRSFNVYGDPRPWSAERPLSFLNTTKYPASLLYLLMTLGPLLAVMPLLGRARNAITNALELFGRMPLFYYVLHIPLIHVAAMVVSLIRTGSVSPWLFGNHPMEPPEVPPGYQWSLPLLYVVTAVCVALLYAICRWWAERRQTETHTLVAPSV